MEKCVALLAFLSALIEDSHSSWHSSCSLQLINAPDGAINVLVVRTTHLGLRRGNCYGLHAKFANETAALTFLSAVNMQKATVENVVIEVDGYSSNYLSHWLNNNTKIATEARINGK